MVVRLVCSSQGAPPSSMLSNCTWKRAYHKEFRWICESALYWSGGRKHSNSIFYWWKLIKVQCYVCIYIYVFVYMCLKSHIIYIKPLSHTQTHLIFLSLQTHTHTPPSTNVSYPHPQDVSLYRTWQFAFRLGVRTKMHGLTLGLKSKKLHKSFFMDQ